MILKVDHHQSLAPISHCFVRKDLLTSSLQLENNVPPFKIRGLEIESCSMGEMAHQKIQKAKQVHLKVEMEPMNTTRNE